jgi:organic hydroperoxide reductase OsmC/OhrA
MVLPPSVTVEAEVDLNFKDDGYFISARLNVSLPGMERAAAQALVNEAHKICAYSKALRGNVDVTIKLI